MSCFLSSPIVSADVLGPGLHARAGGRERESKVDILKNLLKYSIILTAPLDILTSFTTLTADDLFTFSPVRSLLSGMRTFNCLASDFLRGEVSYDFSNISCFGRSHGMQQILGDICSEMMIRGSDEGEQREDWFKVQV